MRDVNEQQLDLRRHNSWLMRMHEVSTPELAEVLAINTMAPFILNSRLKKLMAANRPSAEVRAECMGSCPRWPADSA
ncbi:MAG: hypothetical protein EOO65_01665 [Methanosarcinales archaeon]|nr:MAG: hypothetical protein EOO65_01665 [Methanosarcinales archaeon]